MIDFAYESQVRQNLSGTARCCSTQHPLGQLIQKLEDPPGGESLTRFTRLAGATVIRALL